MYNDKDKQEVKQIIANAKKSLDSLERIQNAALSRIPPEHMPKISGLMADYNQVMRSIKKGDTDAINKITAKYADIN